MLSIPPMSTKIARGPYLMDAIRNLGYANSSLKLVLDAADPDSMVPSQLVSGNQYWKDRSGNGNNFTLGNDPTTEGSEATWSGSDGVNVTGDEYFQVDGSDWFRYNAGGGHVSWQDNLSKPGAGTIAIQGYLASNVETPFVSTDIYGDAASWGMKINYFPSFQRISMGAWGANTTTYAFPNFSSSVALSTPTLFTYVFAWNFPSTLEFSVFCNGSVTGNTVSPPIPWTSNTPVSPMHLMTSPGYDAPNGNRIYSLAIWQGIKMSNTEITNIGNEMMKRLV